MENYEFESFIKDIVLNREVDNMLLEKIKIILEKYKREDVILSVYTLSSWLPNNRASYFKLYILNNILIDMEEKEYEKNDDAVRDRRRSAHGDFVQQKARSRHHRVLDA